MKQKLTFLEKTYKKVNKKGYQFPVSLYSSYIWVLYGEEAKWWDQECKGPQDAEEKHTQGVTHDRLNGSGMVIITFQKKPSLPTIVHESFHAMDFISKQVGLEDEGVNEAKAYLLDYIFERVHETYKQEYKKKNERKQRK